MKNILTLGSRIDWCITDNSTPDIKRLLQKVAIHRISLVYMYIALELMGVALRYIYAAMNVFNT